MTQLAVLHLISSLELGGAERMAVNICNALPAAYCEAHLCATRQQGPLVQEIAPQVRYLPLVRSRKFSASPLFSLLSYIYKYDIKLLHSHSSSLVLAAIMKVLKPDLRIIWHVHHSGFTNLSQLPVRYRVPINFVDGIIVVSDPLLKWIKQVIPRLSSRTWYIANFIEFPEKANAEIPALPGLPGSRIVCVANLRKEKGHLYLLEAMKEVVSKLPAAHLILVVGAIPDPEYEQAVLKSIHDYNLSKHITLMFFRTDVANILYGGDVGVLSSLEEGLPVALLEYGAAGLPVVATDVGHIGAVLDHGKLGVLVAPGSISSLARGIIKLLEEPGTRVKLGEAFQEKIRRDYSKDAIISQVCEIYKTICP